MQHAFSSGPRESDRGFDQMPAAQSGIAGAGMIAAGDGADSAQQVVPASDAEHPRTFASNRPDGMWASGPS